MASGTEPGAGERTVWQGRSSDLLLAPLYLGCAALALALLWAGLHFGLPLAASIGLAALPLLFALARWLQNVARRYVATTERLRVRSGIFVRRTEETEFYRITDYEVVEPLFLRLCGLGHLGLTTSDESDPVLWLRGIRDPSAVCDALRVHVEACRDKKRVRVTELE